MDPTDPQIKAQREQFIKSFQDIAVATKNLHAISVKQIEMMNKMIDSADGLSGAMMAPQDGMRDVLDELIEEVRGLREDIRLVVRGAGLQSLFVALTGQKKRP